MVFNIPYLFLLYLLHIVGIQENLQQWLTDEKARDQFVIRAGSVTEVLWSDARQMKAEPVYKRDVCRTFPVIPSFVFEIVYSGFYYCSCICCDGNYIHWFSFGVILYCSLLLLFALCC